MLVSTPEVKAEAISQKMDRNTEIAKISNPRLTFLAFVPSWISQRFVTSLYVVRTSETSRRFLEWTVGRVLASGWSELQPWGPLQGVRPEPVKRESNLPPINLCECG